MWCFIKTELRPNERQKLVKNGIGFSEYNFKTGGSTAAGIAVPEEQLNDTLKALKLTAVDSKKKRVADANGVCLVTTTAPPTYTKPIELQAVSDSGRKVIEQVVAKFRSELSFDYILRQCSGESTQPLKHSGYLALRFWSYPKGETLAASPSPFQRSALSLAKIPGRYHAIWREPDQLMALFQGNAKTGTLWVTYDLLNTKAAAKELEFILHAVAAYLAKRPAITWQQFCQSAERRRYIELCQLRLKDERKGAAMKFEQAQAALDKAEKAFIAAHRAAEAARRWESGLVEDSSAVMAELLESYGQEYDMLGNSSDITSFKLAKDKLTIKTRAIKIRYDDRTYKMGTYTIVINTVSGSIQVDERHPHVRNRKPCLGNIKEAVAKLVAGRKYGILIPILIRYLESYNASDAYWKLTDL